jgi:YidC/Oxa1 family membrane protein insertase
MPPASPWRRRPCTIMDKRSLLAFFLIALVLIITPYYYQIISPPLPEKELLSENNIEEDAPLEHQPERESIPAQKEKAPYKEKLISVVTPLYSAKVSTRFGGSLSSYELNNYITGDSALVNLINTHNKENLYIGFTNTEGASIVLDEGWYTNTEHFSVDVFDRPQSLSFYLSYGGSVIEKTLIFNSETYVIEVKTDLSGVSDIISGNTFSVGWNGGVPPTETNIKDDLTYFNGYVYQAGDAYGLKKVAPKIKQPQNESLEVVRGKTDWIALRSKYFVSVLIPKTSSELCWAGHNEIEINSHLVPLYSAALGLDSSVRSSVSLYLGPLEYETVKKVDSGIPSIMNFGWSIIRPISRGVLWLLKTIHVWVPNYGVVLIIFSVLVKLAVFPLTKKSHQSSKEMQALQPEITALKEKHKNNPQKVQQATMNLYKERGVNPLGGCLPILIQMPLLFSLFQVFRSTIELRGAPFVWWVRDLSAPDIIFSLPFSIPLYGSGVAVLPLLMGITMFLQQKMMPTQASGQQKFMSYFMTGFFILLFNGFPSGLNLYYTLFNVLTILQQKYLTPSPDKSTKKIIKK